MPDRAAAATRAATVLTRRSHTIEVVGFGHAGARGMKAGGVVNLAQAEDAIRQAVDSAERMAGVELESVVMWISSGRLASELFAADIDIVGSAVSDGDIARVLETSISRPAYGRALQ